MLRDLEIRNVAIIDRLSVEFSPGLNLLTGETGAGKSIIIDALGLCLGNRSDFTLLRSGAKEAVVQAVFSDIDVPEVRVFTRESGIEFNGELILRRRLSDSGVSRAYINDVQINLATMRAFGEMLVTVHGQGEGDELLTPDGQLAMLDTYAGTMADREKIEQLYEKQAELAAELETVSGDERARARELDLLKHQINEIESAKLDPEEEEELKKESRVLMNAERICQLGDGSYELLYGGEDSVTQRISEVEKMLAEIGQLDDRFAEMVKTLEGLRYQIDDVAAETRDYISRIEADPRRLAAVEERLDLYRTLQRKYGATTVEVLSFLKDARKQCEDLEHADERLERIVKELELVRVEYDKKAESLSEKRRNAVIGFNSDVERHLADLAMERARFDVEIEQHPRGRTRSGIDRIRFMLAPNPGAEPKPLNKIASGGEQSRLMLAIKSSSERRQAHRTVIFDEVDSGIGGRVADFLGRKLAGLADGQQVICITHLPQIAAYARNHSIVDKQTDGQKTEVSIRALDERDRVEEIARMLAGEELTDASRDHARGLIQKAKSRQ